MYRGRTRPPGLTPPRHDPLAGSRLLIFPPRQFQWHVFERNPRHCGQKTFPRRYALPPRPSTPLRTGRRRHRFSGCPWGCHHRLRAVDSSDRPRQRYPRVYRSIGGALPGRFGQSHRWVVREMRNDPDPPLRLHRPRDQPFSVGLARRLLLQRERRDSPGERPGAIRGGVGRTVVSGMRDDRRRFRA